MCVFPTCAAKIILLAVIPITIVFCVVEMGFAIYSLNTFFHTKKPEGSQLILLLIMTLLNLVGLVTGYYGTFAKKVMLFILVAYMLVKTFIFIICMDSIKTEADFVINHWFEGSFLGSIVCFLFGFIYSLRLRELRIDAR